MTQRQRAKKGDGDVVGALAALLVAAVCGAGVLVVAVFLLARRALAASAGIAHRAHAAVGIAANAIGQRLVAAASRIDGAPGGIEVHVLTEQCATAQPNEATKLAHFLRRL